LWHFKTRTQVAFATFAAILTVYLTSSDSVVSEKDNLISFSSQEVKEADTTSTIPSPPRKVLCKSLRSELKALDCDQTTPLARVSGKPPAKLFEVFGHVIIQ
jgi:hypothetical protein